MSGKYATSSMLRLCFLDPPKYGWTACGGVASMLEPHEMARRPEAKEKFLKRRRAEKIAAAKAEAAAAAAAATMAAEKEKEKAGSVGVAKEENEDVVSKKDDDDDARKDDAAATASSDERYYTVTDPSAAAPAKGGGGGGGASSSSDAATSSSDTAAVAAGVASVSDPPPSAEGDGGDDRNNNKNNNDNDKAKKIVIRSTVATEDGQGRRLDVYTYHRGRVGGEPRDDETGELLCDTEPVDTNHHWMPSDTVVDVVIDFPLGDPNEEEYVDSDLEMEEEEEEEKGETEEHEEEEERRKEKMATTTGTKEEDAARAKSSTNKARASRSRPSRSGGSSCGGGGGSGPLEETSHNRRRPAQRPHQNRPSEQPPTAMSLPRFRAVVRWDLASPTSPSPEEYAAGVASEYGLTFPQAMDLKESIEAQLAEFYGWRGHGTFRAPVALADPYGVERSAAQVGPPEWPIVPAWGCRQGTTTGTGDDGDAISVVGSSARRAGAPSRKGSSSSNGGGGGGGGTPSGGGSAARTGRSRPVGAVKPDRRGINVVPPDKVPRHDVEGDPHRAEVLKRARKISCAHVREARGRGEEVLEIVVNEVCHICHNRKATGLAFHCGRHAYCDSHCASRLSFRAQDYDKKNPTCIPIDYCPVCTLQCTCAKCTRRLAEVAGKMKAACAEQGCGPGEVVMDDFFDLCSSKQGGPKPRASSGGGSVNKKASGKKARIQAESPAVGAGGGGGGGSPPTADDAGPSSAGDDARSRKRRKTSFEPAAAPVTVAKVPPSDFPKEMFGTEDLDPSTPEDLSKVFTPDGSFPADPSGVGTLPVDPSKHRGYQEKREMKEVSETGNFFHCAECNKESGDTEVSLVCCKNCPRAYHEKCFKDDQKRECKRCGWDVQIRPEEDIVGDQMKPDKKILKAYGKYKDTAPSYTFMSIMISKILQILEKLKQYDYGKIFATPVDTETVPDYLLTIRKPMDYSTIGVNLEKGRYVPSSDTSSPSSDSENNMDAMEEIVLKALTDIEQVHHNCFLYNRKDTPYYRAGEVQANKWKAFFSKHVDERLPENLRSSLVAFQEACAAERLAWASIGRKFNAKSHRSKALSVFDPDTKRIVKQYSSKVSARNAALILYDAGYSCEWELSQTNIKFRMDGAEDPSKPLFGYQWLPTEKLKRGNFKVKPYFRNDDLVSPTPNNIVILKEDSVSGTQLRGFESEESAYQDWELEKLGSFNARVDKEEEDAGNTDAKNHLSEFMQNYIEGDKSINGIVWNRVDQPDKRADGAAMTPKSSLEKVVMEEEHAEMRGT